jgi:uncharacterized protein
MYNLGRLLFPKDKLYNSLVDYPEIHFAIIAIAALIIAFLWGSKTLTRFIFALKTNKA